MLLCVRLCLRRRTCVTFGCNIKHIAYNTSLEEWHKMIRDARFQLIVSTYVKFVTKHAQTNIYNTYLAAFRWYISSIWNIGRPSNQISHGPMVLGPIDSAAPHTDTHAHTRSRSRTGPLLEYSRYFGPAQYLRHASLPSSCFIQGSYNKWRPRCGGRGRSPLVSRCLVPFSRAPIICIDRALFRAKTRLNSAATGPGSAF